MINIRNRKSTVVIILMLIMGIFLYTLFSPPVKAKNSTQINIDLPKDYFKKNEKFYVNISIHPGEPIIGVQVELTFNPFLLQCNDIRKGSSVWDSFFPPTVDNINGKITGAGVAVMGTTVSNSTNCFNITFITQNTSGNSSIVFQNVIVTNLTGNVIDDISQKDASIVITEDKSSTPKEENSKPNLPDVASGPSSGFTNISYMYITSTIDPDDDKIYYLFDWGDNMDSSWVGPYPSGESCLFQHSWVKTGEYYIKVKAKDIFGNETDWTPSLLVTIKEQSESSSISENNNSIPKASFIYEPDLPRIGETIFFKDQSEDMDGNITKYLWDFGDGITATEQHPSHQYTSNRTYAITLTVWDNNEAIDTIYQQITVSSTISEPIESKETPAIGLVVFLSAIAIVLALKRKKLNH